MKVARHDLRIRAVRLSRSRLAAARRSGDILLVDFWIAVLAHLGAHA